MKHSVNRPPTPDEDVADGFEKDELTLGEIINVKLVKSGEKENLMELVRDRLVECGWKDEMRIACSWLEHVKKKGRKDVTVDELIRVITPKGRASVPDSEKADEVKWELKVKNGENGDQGGKETEYGSIQRCFICGLSHIGCT